MKIAYIGGDIRMPESAYYARNKGHKISLLGFDKYEYCPRCFDIENDLSKALKNADAVILGIPASFDGKTIYAPYSSKEIKISELLSKISEKTIIFGGKTDCLNIYNNFKIIDYLSLEEFTLKNAKITAEGAIYTAMSEIPHTINGSECLVMGYGRIGKFLADLLFDMGAKVTCSARKTTDIALAKCNGLGVVNTYDLKNSVAKYDLIFNTIPKKILSEDILSNVRENSLIVDLASKPGGVDFESAKKLGLKVVWATSLPGKLFPQSSGKIITDTVFDILPDYIEEVKKC